MATIGTAIRLTDMMTAPLRNITNAMNMMLSTWTSLECATAGGLDGGDVEAIRSELNKATTALDQMCDEQEEFNRKVHEGASATDGLTNKIMGAVGAFATLQSVGELVNLSDNFTQTQSRLSMIVDMPTMTENISEMEEMAIRQERTDELFNKIVASANRARASISTTADTVAKLSLNAGDAFSSNDETILFAENLNKLFVIARTEQASIASASLQLTQALGSGVLRGEEFNAVYEAAPTILQTVADYMDVPIGQLRSMAQEGQITADVVKNALLSATNDINNQFESMPMTWGQVWTGVMNELYIMSLPLLKVINALANNWSVLEPIVLGVAMAVGVYTAALLINKGIQAASALAESIRGTATTISAGATIGATGAQHGFNAALQACPIVWIIDLIILLIAGLIALWDNCEGFRNFCAESWAWYAKTLGKLYNSVCLPIANGVLSVLSSLMSGIESFCNWVINAFADMAISVVEHFDFIADAIKWLLEKYNDVASFFGAETINVDWLVSTEGINHTRDAVLNANEAYFNAMQKNLRPLNELDLSQWDKWVDDTSEKISNFKVMDFLKSLIMGANGFVPEEYPLDDIPPYDEIANNTDRTANALEITNENLKYLRDLAEQEAVNRFTTAEVRVEMTNNNNISSNMDLDGVVDYVVTGVQEALERTAEGVHS